MISKRFADVQSCPLLKAGTPAPLSAVASLNGVLLRSRNPFPYYMLLALEAGSPLRALLLLLLWPLIWFLWHVLASQHLALQALIFVSTAGIRLSEVSGVSKAVLPKFLLEDLHGQCFQVFMSCGKRRHVVTSFPRTMVEYFLKEHVGVTEVFGTELQVSAGGYCTGLVAGGLMVEYNKAEAVKKMFGEEQPDVGLGSSGVADFPFLRLCKEAYVVENRGGGVVPREKYWKPLVFHDGRLVVRPTPWAALTLFLWAPFGLLLAVARILAAMCLPPQLDAYLGVAMVGIGFRVKGAQLPLPGRTEGKRPGVLYVCNHRTLLDPTFMCIGLRRRVCALTYSLSWISERVSPIPIAQLTRDRKQDARLIRHLLAEGDLVVCPEGTTCREPYLLRFSSLFAELTEHIAPVAVRVKTTMFWGSSARGYKALDALFFLMNPRPAYEIIFLERLGKEETIAGGKSSVEVAKAVQKRIAEALGYACTEWTRKDKYRILAGHDGTVQKEKRSVAVAKPTAACAPDAAAALLGCSATNNKNVLDEP